MIRAWLNRRKVARVIKKILPEVPLAEVEKTIAEARMGNSNEDYGLF